jgi:hypothetical protein
MTAAARMEQQPPGGRPLNALLPRWLITIAAGVPLALIVLAASPIGLDWLYSAYGIPALLLVWKLAGVCAAFLAVRAAIQRAWRQAIAASVLPLVVLIVALDPIRFLWPVQYVGNIGHFAMMFPSYEIVVAGLPRDKGPRLAEFDWDGISGLVTFAVVYDESDQITLDRPTAAWQAQAKSELSCEGFGVVQPFWAHFYLVSFPC